MPSFYLITTFTSEVKQMWLMYKYVLKHPFIQDIFKQTYRNVVFRDHILTLATYINCGGAPLWLNWISLLNLYDQCCVRAFYWVHTFIRICGGIIDWHGWLIEFGVLRGGRRAFYKPTTRVLRSLTQNMQTMVWTSSRGLIADQVYYLSGQGGV